jgi:serine/threonine-protein kinase RsbT
MLFIKMMEFKFEIEGSDFSKAGMASSEVKKILKQLNLAPSLIKKIAVAMYEAEVNIVAHAFKGKMIVTIESDNIRMLFEDEGPGIADIDKAMVEGYSTASEEVRQHGFGAGMGLSNIKRNSDFLNINSIVGKGTTVEIVTNLNQSLNERTSLSSCSKNSE